MVKINIFIVLLFPCVLLGQITANFQVNNELSLCKNSAISLENTSSTVEGYYWDFCPETFTETASVSMRSLPNFSAGYGYRVVEDNGQWFGFLLGRSANKLYRLDFGETPYSSPALIDLGNPGGLFSGPEGLDFYKENGNWFAFTGKGDNGSGQIVRLSFGSSLQNIPTATGLGSFGYDGTSIREVRIVNQGNDVILLAIGYGFNAINRINFGNSILNAPVSQSSLTIPGAALPISFSVVQHESPWKLHVLSDNGQIQQLNFGNNIMGSMSVEGAFTFGAIGFPLKIHSVYSNGSFFSIVSDAAFKYAIINFNDLSLSQAPTVVTNNNSVRYISFDIIKFRGTSILQGSYNDLFTTATYQAFCTAAPGYSYQRDPDPFHFSAATTQNIDLNLFNRSTKQFKSNGITINDSMAPVIDFSHDKICVQSSIEFSYSSSTALSSLNWSFGDSNTSTQSNPANLYNQAGHYQVTLKAIDVNNCFNLTEKEIQLYDQVLPTFDIPSISPLCTNQTYIFKNTSISDDSYPVTWSWRVNGTAFSTSNDLTYITTQVGSLDVELTALVKGCSNSLSKSVGNIIAGPVVNFNFIGSCQDQPFQFINNSVGEGSILYNWTYNGIESQSTNVEYQFLSGGDYQVKLTGTSDNGCNNSTEKTVSVRSTPNPSFFIDLPPFSCAGSPTQFNDATPLPNGSNLVSWQWDFGDGATGTQQNPQHVYALPGNYSVTLETETNFGCKGTTQIEVTIAATPTADFTIGATCLNQGTPFESLSMTGVNSWQWSIGNSVYTIPNPIHTFTQSGTYQAKLIVVGQNNCESMVSKAVTVKPVPLLDFSNSIACSGQTTIFTDQSSGTDLPQSWTWSLDGATGSGSPVSHTFETAGAKPVTMQVITEAGCHYALNKNVIVAPSPTAAFTASPNVGPPPLAVQFTNTSQNSTSYAWHFGLSNATSALANPSFTYANVGDYLVELTATNNIGCSDVQSQIISVLIPTYDLTLTSLDILQPTGSSGKSVMITVRNNSNIQINSANTLITGSSGLRVKSNLIVNLAAQTSADFLLPIEVFSNEEYLCVDLDLETDINPADNQRCQALLSGPAVAAPYPNPAQGQIFFDVVMKQGGSGQLQVTDIHGQTVFNELFQSLSEGLNRKEIDLSAQAPGLYIAIWELSGQVFRFPFLIR